jgi:cytoskeletal protein CcmA (bactofilin family)
MCTMCVQFTFVLKENKLQYSKFMTIFMRMLRNNEEEEKFENTTPDEVETIVGPSVKVEGDFVSKGNVVIEGTVMGSVKTERNLRVEEGAIINASVAAENVRVAGEIRGNVQALGLLELTPTARVIGDVYTKTLVIAAGAILHGNCNMSDEKPASRATQSKKTSRAAKEEDFEIEFDDMRSNS